jgi:hypothetical protein
MNIQLGWLSVRRTVSLGDDVTEGDHIEIAVYLLPLADPASLAEWVRGALEKQGWTREADGTMTKTFGEARATLARDGSKVTLAAEGGLAVRVQASAEKTGEEVQAAAEAESAARAEATRRLEEAREGARRQLVADNERKILEAEPTLRREIDQAVNEATKVALERRARALGTIENVNETTDEDGRYRLRIEVRT